MPGYIAEFDVRDQFLEDTDLRFRESFPILGTGQLLATTGGFANVGSTGPDEGFQILPNTEYTATVSYTLDADGNIELFSSLEGTGVGGDPAAPFSVSHSVVDSDGPFSTTFGFFGIGVSSDAFGVSNDPGLNAAGVEIDGLANDNGIEITNVRIEFSEIPEPSSLMLAFAAVAPLVRRKKRS